MSDIKTVDIILLNDAFAMGGGYVLNFSDRTFGDFFREELNLDIDDPAYKVEGTSKAKRLRCFLKKVDNETAARTIIALWEYRGICGVQFESEIINLQGRLLDLVAKLKGLRNQPHQVPKPAHNSQRIESLRRDFEAIFGLSEQSRGYAFEKLLKSAFDLYGLQGKSGFRLQGEQIDGSFVLDHSTYLLEAKWTSKQIGVADLYVFEGKLGEKASWTRGLFVSYSGFTSEGLSAFGRGKRTVCMDGLDLHQLLSRELPLDQVLRSKVRKAAETGDPYVPVASLF